ncbi:acyltransferase family protein [Bacillus paramobilis]|uniref:acyltransferase family protein n=1 Tax=Bacillus paramobilis TaxID=2817477 RepID=UPI000BFAA57E|nr:hypothetical protein CN386_00575 [Bacillus cereus]
MSNGKLHYINNLKAFLAVLVVLFHTSSAYGGAGGWYYIEPSDDAISISILTLINALCQSFFMGLFFFIAAYFSPRSYDNKGFSKFLRDRVPKLLIPAFVYFFVLNPISINLVKKQSYLSSLGFYNLWFVMALFYFTVAYAIIRKTTTIKMPQISFPGINKIFCFILFMGICNFIVRLLFPTDRLYIHDFTLGYFPQYIALFLLGVIAYRNSWLNQISERTASVYFRISIVSFITMPIVFLFNEGNVDNFYGGVTLESLYYSFWEPFTFVGIILKLLVLFKKKLNFTTPLLSTISRSSYSIYIIQGPIIVALQLMSSTLEMNIILKTIYVTSLTFALSLGISVLLLRIPKVNKII